MPKVEGSREGNSYRPLVEVDVQVEGNRQTITALVDSGADYTTLPTALVEGIAGKSLVDIPGTDTTVEGIGGKQPAKLVSVMAWYAGRPFATEVIATATPRPLLGRLDFMARFNVRFYWGKQPPEFYVEPADPARPNAPHRTADKRRK